ncbi:HNH endonuclease [Bartonella sp. W8098]|nr:HNH endonuclease [Bartonella apis]MBI0170839.1 HNH endonuclease [Bartonella sp. W8151]
MIRRVERGGDEIDNLLILHPNCHRLIHNHEMDKVLYVVFIHKININMLTLK